MCVATGSQPGTFETNMDEQSNSVSKNKINLIAEKVRVTIFSIFGRVKFDQHFEKNCWTVHNFVFIQRTSINLLTRSTIFITHYSSAREPTHMTASENRQQYFLWRNVCSCRC